jgi:hypothetical protein
MDVQAGKNLDAQLSKIHPLVWGVLRGTPRPHLALPAAAIPGCAPSDDRRIFYSCNICDCIVYYAHVDFAHY